MPPRTTDTTASTIQAGLLTWLIPGAGHYFLGQRALAVVFFVAITLPYLTGLAIGGVVNSVNPRTNRWLFLAELGVGGYTVPSFFVTRHVENSLLAELKLNAIPEQIGRVNPDFRVWDERRSQYVAYFPESDIAQIYLATAGLLNILAILDAISRAQTGGLPTYHRDLPPVSEGEPS